ncbi:MAG: response regulator transcription factor [Deltaproteobacteria bacterium]|nr:response regulator transcription factor [bacterium]MCB9478149.1 response regulator transcription factor [Deltaproteobacteria bacterium]MCB9487644.1 response regulator transcription factor [Deltaproteobacteria bacterium]
MIRILIVDDHAILRYGLRALFDARADMEVVGEASDTSEAIRQAEATTPDIVLLDLTMPGRSGVQAISEIHKVSPKSRCLILTMHDDPVYLKSVLAAGGAGYVVKKSAHNELLTAIKTVHEGRSYIGLTLPTDGLKEVTDIQAARANGGRNGSSPRLSRRERDVLRLVAHGFTNKQIAEKLSISLKTVETYRSRVTEKLGLKHRADLVRYALDLGLLQA